MTEISIHALLAESDKIRKALDLDDCEFLSTLSLRRATLDGIIFLKNVGHFYPRSPCGERQRHARASSNVFEFLSTLSLRRATRYSLRHSA